MSTWKQFQSNPSNQGYVPLQTGPLDAVKWKVEVGPVAFASPVIGNNGDIYIGNLLAELEAIAPDSSIRWKRSLDLRP